MQTKIMRSSTGAGKTKKVAKLKGRWAETSKQTNYLTAVRHAWVKEILTLLGQPVRQMQI